LEAISIFIVEDEPSIAQVVKHKLESEGFSVSLFSTGAECVAELEQVTPSLILLDVGLSDGNGFDFFRQFREFTKAPVIFMTARGDEIDRVVGLEMGADDYIVKPFSIRELVARVKVVLRRIPSKEPSVSKEPSNRLVLKGLFSINEDRKQIHYRDSVLDLTLHEYRLLGALLDCPGKVFSRYQLLEKGWESPDHRLERTIDTHIKTLRTKLRQIDTNANPICTHRGLGYSLELES